MEDPAHPHNLKRASRSAAIMFLIVFVMAAAAASYSYVKLNAVEERIQQSKEENARLQASVKDLNEKVQILRSPPGSSPVRVLAQALPATRSGAPLFDLAIWLDRSNFTQPVKQVTYQSRHPFLRQPKTVSEPRTGFAIGFRGTECPKRVAISVVFEDQSMQAIDFDMCGAARKGLPAIPCY